MTLFVEIDVSKYKHDPTSLNVYGENISKHFQFPNIYQLFQQLKKHPETLEIRTSELHAVLKNTDHHTDSLVSFLQKIGYPTFTYKPLLIKKFVKSLTLSKSKTDKKEAPSIVRKLLADPTLGGHVVETFPQFLLTLCLIYYNISKKYSSFPV
ncbi:IS110 family transposase [Lactococcus formosensis]|uniref:IS110 family transposase n=1 Tax=Lactococcus formosensis TaxID=1281486 RepID=A0A9X4PAD4_9LACT|nr:transposase [Lactococcus formosensis]MDG6160838.1 IS110 family transposase [Lactococcus formosensis]MDG6167326.1 IS110 family transposase [Lactococcus formosensis]MDG6194497.1 IS110 family transposase [Lactococcus formosensis]